MVMMMMTSLLPGVFVLLVINKLFLRTELMANNYSLTPGFLFSTQFKNQSRAISAISSYSASVKGTGKKLLLALVNKPRCQEGLKYKSIYQRNWPGDHLGSQKIMKQVCWYVLCCRKSEMLTDH